MKGPGRNGPLVAAWLRLRIEGKVLLHERQRVQEVNEADDGVALTLSNGMCLRADHIMLGTGYRADINKLPMLPFCRVYRCSSTTYSTCRLATNSI